MNVHDDDEDEDLWVSPPFSSNNSLHLALHDFESSLRCPICHRFLTIPVNLLPCQHSFCSECIRLSIKASLKGMNGTKQSPICPFCRKDLSVSGSEKSIDSLIVPNRPAEEMIQRYKVIRPDLKYSVGLLATNGSTHVSKVSSLVLELIRSRNSASLVALQSALSSSFDNDAYEQVGDRKRRRTTRTMAISAEPQVMEQIRKKKPTTYYNLLSLKKLREKCKEEGLSTQGDERALRLRHQEFTILYNAECDSSTPRSQAELVREIANRENARAREDARQSISMSNATHAHVTHMEELKNSRTALSYDRAVVTNGNSYFDSPHSLHHPNFAKLIAKAKKRMKPSVTLEESKEKWVNVSVSSKVARETPSGQATMSSMPVAHNNPAYASAALGMPSSMATMTDMAKAPPAEEPLFGSGTTNSVMAKEARTAEAELSSGLPSARKSAMNIKSFLVTNPKVKSNAIVFHGSGRSSNTKQPSPAAINQRGRPSICGPWNCHMCTFFNTKNTWSRAVCEMCFSK